MSAKIRDTSWRIPRRAPSLCIPLIYKDKVIGVLDIEHTRRNYFNEDHVRIMTTMAAQVAIAIENATLYERIARQEKRLEQDLALARELQFRLLPQKLPVFKNAEVASRFAPARQIGGDLYDFLKYSGQGVTGIAVGDVSGKGAPAAIYAALVSGIARSHANEEPSAAGMLEAINLSLSERPIEGQYVSMIYAIWDDNQQTAAARELRIAAALSTAAMARWKRFRRPACPSDCSSMPRMKRCNLRASRATPSCSSATAFWTPPARRARCSAGIGWRRSLAQTRTAAPKNWSTLSSRLYPSHAEGVEAFDDQTIVALKVKGPSRQRSESRPPASERPPGFTYRRESRSSGMRDRELHADEVPLASWPSNSARRSMSIRQRPFASAIGIRRRPSAAASTPSATR